MHEWREEFEDVVARGRAAHGDDAVRGVLDELVASLSARPAPLAPSIPVLGAAACASGWVGVLVRPSGRTTLHVAATIDSLVDQVREQESLGVLGLVDAEHQSARAWLATRPAVSIVEVTRRDGPVGERREWLVTQGAAVPAMYGGMGFEETDLLAAAEAAVEAARPWS